MTRRIPDWISRLFGDEPIITRVGPVIALIATYLVARGVLDSDTAQLIAGVLALLGGGTAMASARGQVWSKLPESAELPESGD